MRWTAVLAPLYVTSHTGRRLAADFTITLHGPAPLIEDVPGHDQPRIGTVDRAEVRDGMLVASGTVDAPVIAVRMGNRELRPQVDLREVTYHGLDAELSSAVLAAVHAGSHPDWPGARFTIDPPAGYDTPMAFGQALEVLKYGGTVTRPQQWPGAGHDAHVRLAPATDTTSAHLVMRIGEGRLTPWLPQADDLLAEDWQAVR